MPRCALCSSERLIVESSRATDALVSAYTQRFGVDTTRFFSGPDVTTLRCAECDLRMHVGGTSGDSAFYDSMQLHPFYYEKDKPEFDYAIDRIVACRPSNVLEVGCGEGNFLRKIQPAYDVRGSELSERSKATLARAGIELDDADRQYDFVCSFQVLEHVTDAAGFLQFMSSKLAAGGHLLVTVPNRDSPYIQAGTSSILDFPPHHMTQWSRPAITGIASFLGLELLDYYEEPMRAVHLSGLMAARRAQIPAGRRAARIGRLVGRLADLVLVPYHLDRIDYKGLTHGVLLHRPH